MDMITVAIADDHVLFRAGLAKLILYTRQIIVPWQASDGRELIAKLEASTEFPDVVLLDINMPDMNGFDTQTELMRRWPHVKTLVISTFEHWQYIIRMIKEGAKGYLAKNCSPDELVGAIHAIAGGGVYFSNIPRNHLVKAAKDKAIKLTAEELRLLRESVEDLTYAQIAEKLGKTMSSIEGHRTRLFRKLNVKTRAALIVEGIKLGLIVLDIPYDNLNTPDS